MFFIKTEERVITREELLSEKILSEALLSEDILHCHTEYLTSAVCNDENGEREFVSGVSTIQQKWDPFKLYIDIEAADVASSIMAEVTRLVDDPEDLAVIHRIIEETKAHCEAEPCEAKIESDMVEQVRERLMKLYRQEYNSLIWNGSICSEVRVVPEPVMDEHGYIDICSKAYTSVVLCFTPISELKKQAESDFFCGYNNLSRRGVTAVFQLKMLRFPEAMVIAKLREYFGAIAELLRAKTVFESDMRENPIHVMGEMVYYPDEINARLGTGLVEEVQSFGWALKNNRCFEALCAFERVQRLQKEVCKITDQKVKEMTIEALSVLNQNWDALKKYFDIWDTYIGDIVCSEQGLDAYLENISLADYKEADGGCSV